VQVQQSVSWARSSWWVVWGSERRWSAFWGIVLGVRWTLIFQIDFCFFRWSKVMGYLLRAEKLVRWSHSLLGSFWKAAPWRFLCARSLQLERICPRGLLTFSWVWGVFSGGCCIMSHFIIRGCWVEGSSEPGTSSRWARCRWCPLRWAKLFWGLFRPWKKW
jgi:hypothetical protein